MALNLLPCYRRFISSDLTKCHPCDISYTKNEDIQLLELYGYGTLFPMNYDYRRFHTIDLNSSFPNTTLCPVSTPEWTFFHPRMDVFPPRHRNGRFSTPHHPHRRTKKVENTSTLCHPGCGSKWNKPICAISISF